MSACGGGDDAGGGSAPATYKVGGTVSGLTGSGLVLANNGGNNLAVSDSGAFGFSTALSSGTAYSVAVVTQPTNPNQTCTVTNGSGTVGSGNVTNVSVACTTNTPSTYIIGGTVSGLSGSGLVLADNGGNNLAIAASGAFTFSGRLTSGAAYSVAVVTQPTNPNQTCSVANGSGTVGGGNVTNVSVACKTNTPGTYTLGGTVSGLAGSGLVLADNRGNDLAIAASGAFTFSGRLKSGTAYSVTVATQPANPNQTCAVTNGIGTIGTTNIANIAVACTNDTYTVGGTISGLTGSGLVLLDNGKDNLAVSSGSTSFRFATPLVTGASYQVTIGKQPTGLSCTVANGSGTVAGGPVSNIALSCAGLTAWTFESGAMTEVTFGTDPAGVYGKLGVAAAGNVPGGRAGVTTWTDGTNLWLFGGAQATNSQIYGDLWKYNIASGLWTWVGGSENFGSTGVYGQLGSAAPNNIPGARFGAVAWTDRAGVFWMFGGTGFDSTGTLVLLNDLWKYTPATNLWSWVSGSNTGNQSGVYGTIGTPAGANIPGGRTGAASWIDASGNLYLFGGSGLDSSANQDALNDLWIYSPGTSRWTWVSGANSGGAFGVYGTQGVAAAANAPGARELTSSWTDSTGILWMFGGNGFARSTTGQLSDLWKFTPGTGRWTWMAGSQAVNQLGVYGMQGTASASNAPGARFQAATWVDSKGKLRMFGGYGNASSVDPFAISDFWLYDPALNEWTWTGGPSDDSEPGICGTQGVASPTNIPGARYEAGSWIDGTGNLWLFGGTGANCLLNGGYDNGGQMNDLWRYGE